MPQRTAFILTLFALLLLAWLSAGERFLDWAFFMPDVGIVDDIALAILVRAEEAKAAFGLPDLFGALRGGLHAVLGV